MRIDRRKFLRQTIQAALGASLYSAFGNLQLVQAATRATNYAFTDYKALVCVFLYGGNDSFNTVVPYTLADFNAFFGPGGVRPKLGTAPDDAALALNRTTLHPLTATATSGDGIQYAMHAGMPELATLFNQASSPLAILANVGPLIQPTTQAQVIAGTAPLPPQLTSHSDQTAYWQSSPPTNNPNTGWGGRICDMVASANPAGIPIMTSMSGPDVFLRGEVVNGYVMNAREAPHIDLPYDPHMDHLTTAYNLLHAQDTQAHVMERTFAATGNHAEATAVIINGALDNASVPSFDAFFPGADGGNFKAQLKTTARLIWAAYNNVPGYSGLKRQVFYVNTGGYDTHSDQLAQHNTLLPELSSALAGFYNALNSITIPGGTLAKVATAFTASDFGRTMSTNDNGTDHGWGGHHFILGGAVQGGKFYGNGCGFGGAAGNYGLVMPSLINPTTDYDVPSPNKNDSGDGRGELIPTTAVEQYGATLASWFGLSQPDIDLVFPNLANFSIKNMGFV